MLHMIAWNDLTGTQRGDVCRAWSKYRHPYTQDDTWVSGDYSPWRIRLDSIASQHGNIYYWAENHLTEVKRPFMLLVDAIEFIHDEVLWNKLHDGPGPSVPDTYGDF